MELPKISRTLIKASSFLIVILALASVAGQISKFYLGHGNLKGFVRLFSLDIEANAPTLYSFFLLLTCSFLLTFITLAKLRARDSFTTHWACLAVIFYGLASTEISLRIEAFVGSSLHAVNIGDSMYTTWISPVIITAVMYFKFIIGLPAKTRSRFILAGLVFWTGGVGMELVNLHYAETHGYQNIEYVLMTNLEEVLEMIGTVIFIRSLVSYIFFQMEVKRFNILGEGGALSVPRVMPTMHESSTTLHKEDA